ncbi:extracellular solute-binding protein [Jiangella aurantiaca]|uniref:Extracellular solute-binding protein n=1 Tax=Jiangella aurantiaca TaxID=2530373 RepID=A0A4R5A680_9ACTN|nr:extracellular solute-binding protein [Jiangella aurantiaca]TDD67095.1 extracellular solute-binding protein [Jiangella aurantiaca]
MTTLRVLCWDDPRCLAPMRAAATAFAAARPGVRVEVAGRPLAAFNDQPIEEAAAGHDVVVFDYPMAPRAAESGALLPVRPAGAGAVGAAHGSFDWDGRSWGIPVDAACQVAVSRADLLPATDVPRTWADVLAFARAHPGRVAVPLFHSDVLCALLSITAAVGAPIGPGGFVADDSAVEVLCELAALLDDQLLDRNPPAVLAELATSDRWLYSPLLFGYARWSAGPGAADGEPAPSPTGARLAWHDAPTGPDGVIGSLLGGAGLGVSAASTAPDLAAEFAAWYGGADVQRRIVGPSGGQPAAAAAWDDQDLDRAFGGFYSATRRSMLAAVRRPAHPRWPAFQYEAGLLLRDGLAGRARPAGLAAELRAMQRRHGIPTASTADDKVVPA